MQFLKNAQMFRYKILLGDLYSMSASVAQFLKKFCQPV